MPAYQYIYVMKGLGKTYPGGREVLKDIWLSFLPGAKIGVLGLNGAGKSTLLRIMAGEERDFIGEAWAAEGVRIGFASCIQVRDTVLLPHVEVDVDRRDLGIGSMLVRRAMDDARAEGNTVLPLCPFTRRWVDLHPAYVDVARKPKAGEMVAVSSLLAADRTMRLLHHDEAKATTVAVEPDTA